MPYINTKHGTDEKEVSIGSDIGLSARVILGAFLCSPDCDFLGHLAWAFLLFRRGCVDAGFAFIVTWLNPQALIDGTLMLGAFRASLPVGSNPYFISGFASASFLWFSSLAVAVHLLGRKINSLVLTWLNRICGVVIILYGIKLLYSLVQML